VVEEIAVGLVQQILLNLTHIAAVGRDEHSGIVLLSPEEMLMEALDGAAAPDLVRQYAQQLRLALDGAQHIEAARLSELAEQLEFRTARDPSVEHKLAEVDHVLAHLLTICLLKNTAQVFDFQMPLSQPEIFRYIHKIQDTSVSDQPCTVILGKISRDATINFGENDIYLSKIALRYTSSRPYPLLTIYRRSFSQIDGMSGSRTDWQQQASERYDLQFSETGRILTRVMDLPCNLPLSHGSLFVPEQTNVSLISTKIMNPDGDLLAECIRVAEQQHTTST
jgi:hypothetical protein